MRALLMRALLMRALLMRPPTPERALTAARAANAQADPHCTLCGGGESEAGNEILLCDGLHCVGCYHQQCVSPPVLEVPEGAWLCSSCVANGNIVDPQVEEDERKAEECAGGAEGFVVLANDGVGDQDVPLLLERCKRIVG